MVVGVTCYDCYYVGVDILAGTEFLAEFDKVQAAFCGLGVVAVVCGLVLILSNCFCEPKATNRGRVQGSKYFLIPWAYNPSFVKVSHIFDFSQYV